MHRFRRYNMFSVIQKKLRDGFSHRVKPSERNIDLHPNLSLEEESYHRFSAADDAEIDALIIRKEGDAWFYFSDIEKSYFLPRILAAFSSWAQLETLPLHIVETLSWVPFEDQLSSPWNNLTEREILAVRAWLEFMLPDAASFEDTKMLDDGLKGCDFLLSIQSS